MQIRIAASIRAGATLGSEGQRCIDIARGGVNFFTVDATDDHAVTFRTSIRLAATKSEMRRLCATRGPHDMAVRVPLDGP
jgi:hypothetical protein